MSQSQQPVATSPSGATGSGTGGAGNQVQARATASPPAVPASEPANTPGQLRLWRLLIVTLCLVATGVSVVLLFSARGSIQQAAGSTEQLIRLHQVKTSLLQADADATNSFLTGQESPEYNDAVDRASELVVTAAQAQPEDREALARLNRAIVDYNATTSLAKANNRQNFPVGASYLDDAGAQLRSDALPVIDELVAANTDRLEDQARLPSLWLVLAIQAVPLTLTGFVLYRVARHFKRVLNIGLTGAVLALAAALAVGATAAGGSVSDVRRITDDHLVSAIAVAEARSHAFDAKAYEGLSLISRARAAEYNSDWQVASLHVNQALNRAGQDELAGQWRVNEVNHRKIRSLDADGDFDGAKALATSEQVVTDFNTFDDDSSQTLDRLSADSIDLLHRLEPRLLLAGIATGVLGLAAAALATWGIGVRLREYR